jgi:DNA-binding transcriptional ArsR family regulator
MRASSAPFDAAARLFAVLAHPGRIQILAYLRDHGETQVSELAEALDTEQSAMSHQLRTLRDAHLVIANKEGRTVRYQVADDHVTHLVRDVLAHCAEER